MRKTAAVTALVTILIAALGLFVSSPAQAKHTKQAKPPSFSNALKYAKNFRSFNSAPVIVSEAKQPGTRAFIIPVGPSAACNNPDFSNNANAFVRVTVAKDSAIVSYFVREGDNAISLYDTSGLTALYHRGGMRSDLTTAGWSFVDNSGTALSAEQAASLRQEFAFYGARTKRLCEPVSRLGGLVLVNNDPSLGNGEAPRADNAPLRARIIGPGRLSGMPPSLQIAGQEATINSGGDSGLGFVAGGYLHNIGSLAKCGSRVTLVFKTRLLGPDSGKSIRYTGRLSTTRTLCY